VVLLALLTLRMAVPDGAELRADEIEPAPEGPTTAAAPPPAVDTEPEPPAVVPAPVSESGGALPVRAVSGARNPRAAASREPEVAAAVAVWVKTRPWGYVTVGSQRWSTEDRTMRLAPGHHVLNLESHDRRYQAEMQLEVETTGESRVCWDFVREAPCWD
jgi:hypothetical protein